MTNKAISQLSAGSAIADTDLFPDVQTVGVGPVKVTGAQLKTYTSASPTLVTPTLGVAAGTSLALGGATIGGNALAVTGTVLLNTALSVASGGTGISTLTAANNALYSTSASALTAGTLPVAAGGTGVTSLTTGRIPFGAGTSAFSSSSNLFWDSSNNRLGVGTSTPGVTLDVVGVVRGAQVALSGTYTDGATTPTVANTSYMLIANTAPTTITNFTNAVAGQVLYLAFSDTNTTITTANAYLAGAASYVSTANGTLTLLWNGTAWLEVSRSVNS